MFDSKNVKENYNLTSAKSNVLVKNILLLTLNTSSSVCILFINLYNGDFSLPQSIYTIYFISLNIVKNRNIQISC